MTITNDTKRQPKHLRHQLEGAWATRTALPIPPLSEQGSYAFAMQLLQCVEQNDTGHFTNNQIISENPYCSDKNNKRRRDPSSQGSTSSEDSEHKERQQPHNFESWNRQMITWQNTLLMCIWSRPHITRLQITKTELDRFYNHLLGEEIYKTKPPPAMRTIMTSERRCWQKIRELLHQGLTLSTCLDKMINDTLFWQREVFELNKTPCSQRGTGTEKPELSPYLYNKQTVFSTQTKHPILTSQSK